MKKAERDWSDSSQCGDNMRRTCVGSVVATEKFVRLLRQGASSVGAAGNSGERCWCRTKIDTKDGSTLRCGSCLLELRLQPDLRGDCVLVWFGCDKIVRALATAKARRSQGIAEIVMRPTQNYPAWGSFVPLPGLHDSVWTMLVATAVGGVAGASVVLSLVKYTPVEPSISALPVRGSLVVTPTNGTQASASTVTENTAAQALALYGNLVAASPTVMAEHEVVSRKNRQIVAHPSKKHSRHFAHAFGRFASW